MAENVTTIPEKVVLLDTIENDNKATGVVKALGGEVVGRTRWDGDVPEGSYVFINPFVRMSTPEFYFFRRCGDPDNEDALELAVTLLSHYGSHMTTPMLEDGEYEYNAEPPTNESRLREYLSRVKPCLERDTALRVLDEAIPLVEGFERAVGKYLWQKCID